MDPFEKSHIKSVSERKTLHLRKTDIYINYIWIHDMKTEVKNIHGVMKMRMGKAR